MMKKVLMKTKNSFFIFFLLLFVSSCSYLNKLNLCVTNITSIDSTHSCYTIKGNKNKTFLKDTSGLFNIGDSLILKPTEYSGGLIYNLNSISPCEEFSFYEVKRGKSKLFFKQIDSIKYDFNGINKFRLIKK